MTGHYVYRYFDEAGALLYVGCTSDPVLRDKQHASASAWHRFAVEHSVEGPTDRAEALAREARAIGSESPRFNIARGSLTPTTTTVSACTVESRIVEHVERRMGDLGVSPFSLAARLGVPLVTLARYLKGARPWPVPLLMRAADALDTTLSALAGTSEGTAA